MILYDEPLYRPPSEADSLIIQATLGCSHNRCLFCDMYRSKSYVQRPFAGIAAEIDSVGDYIKPSRVFLADGDALSLDTDDLLRITEKLSDSFPALRRISIYASPGNIIKKSSKELESLAASGLTLLYLGIESGSDDILRRIDKGALFQQHKEAITKASSCGMDVSAMVITGLGGRGLWREHIEETARLITEAPPAFLSTLSLMLTPGTLQRFAAAFGGSFTQQDDTGMLEEVKLLIRLANPSRKIIFRSNHASNALTLRGLLPEDKQKLIERLETALCGDIEIRPNRMRGF